MTEFEQQPARVAATLEYRADDLHLQRGGAAHAAQERGRAGALRPAGDALRLRPHV